MLGASNYPQKQGFTLIESVAAIVVTAIAVVGLVTVFFSQTMRSIEPLHQIRAAKLGEALMEEILSKPYSETTPLGGVPPCQACGGIGMDSGESSGSTPVRLNFDDVDDYHGYCKDNNNGDPWEVENIQGNSLEGFERFAMSICIDFDGDYNGVPDSDENTAKLIILEIYPPSFRKGSNGEWLWAEPLIFKAYRSNF